MASGITLSAGIRQNLLSLQSTADLMATTQNRLATGKKVNSALDNPINFFTSSSLQSRAGDLGSLLDSMSNGIKTLEAANNGLTSITNTVQSMQSTLRQARQDKSFQTQSYSISSTATGNLSFSGGAVGSTPVNVALTTTTGTPATSGKVTTGAFSGAIDLSATNSKISFDIKVDGAASATTVTLDKATVDSATGRSDGKINDESELAAAINKAFQSAGVTGATATADTTAHTVSIASSTTGTSSSIDISNVTSDDGTGTALSNVGGITTGNNTGSASSTSGGATVTKTVDQLVSDINSNASLKGKVLASNDNGKLRIQNLSTADLTLGGATDTGTVNGSSSTTSIKGNDNRKAQVQQFNQLLDQLNKTADDSSYNGVNLLRGDKLKLTFNELGTSTMEIQVKDKNGQASSVDAGFLGITAATNSDFDSDDKLDSMLDNLTTALNTLRSQASSFGSNLSIVQNRQDFTKAMVNTLQTGADNLVLADTNEEGANLLALQTRQQLSTTALSLSAQASQAVLRLF